MLELDDIQGLIVQPYAMPCCRCVFLRISDAAGARALLGDLAGEIRTAERWTAKPASCINVGFSHAGLVALGLPEATLATFSEEFRAGIASRAAILGDVGASSPERWDPGMNDRDAHVLFLLSTQTPEVREAETERLVRMAQARGGIPTVALQDLDLEPDLREHFGYRDGFSQPILKGSGMEPIPGQEPLAPGEFVLGYPDEEGEVPGAAIPPELARNGSFLALRKLHQDVAAFRNFLRDNAEDVGSEELMAAKMMGRWRSGAPVVLCPDTDDPELGCDPARTNNFNYDEDPLGFKCPRGAHIRRANPRDALHNSTRHRLMRRGLPYGPRLPEGVLADDGVDRGVIILMINADYGRQFEFIQQVWLNSSNFIGLGPQRDPIAGANDGTTRMTVNRFPLPWRTSPLPRFVTVRGGGYFFLPGIRALRLLAGLTSPEAPPT
jgi:Dyp-type peroxidase family